MHSLHVFCCNHSIHGTIMPVQGWLVTILPNINWPTQLSYLVSVSSMVGALWKVLKYDVNIFGHGAHSHTYILIHLIFFFFLSPICQSFFFFFKFPGP